MGILILTLPSAMSFMPKSGLVVVSMLFLSLLGLALGSGKTRLDKWEKYFVFSFFTYFFIVAVNLWWFDGSLRELDTPSRFLLVLPIFFFIRRLDLDTIWLFLGVAFAAIFASLVKLGLIDLPYVSKVITVQTGVFSLFASICALSSLFFINKENSILVNILFLLAFILGLLASYLSGGRGVWVASIFTFVTMLLINPGKWKKKAVYTAYFLFFGIFTFSYLMPTTGVKDRIDSAITNVLLWKNNDVSHSSSGARLEMWKASYKIIKDNFMAGVGEGNYAKHQQELINQGKIDKSVGGFYHPHNEYLSSFIEQGVLGFFATVFIMLYPIFYFLNQNQRYLSCFQYRGAMAVGLCTSLHYLFYSFTANVFAHQSSTLFYTTILVISIGMLSSIIPTAKIKVS